MTKAYDLIMFVLICTALTFLGAFLGTIFLGDLGFFLGGAVGAVLGWYCLGNWLNVDDH